MADLPFNEPNALPIRTNRARKLLANFIGGVPGFQMLVRYLADVVERVDSGALLQGPNVSVSGGYFAGADTSGQTGKGSFVTPDGVSGQDSTTAFSWGFDNETGSLTLRELLVGAGGISVKSTAGNFIGSFDYAGTLTWGDPVSQRLVLGAGFLVGIDGSNYESCSIDTLSGTFSGRGLAISGESEAVNFSYGSRTLFTMEAGDGSGRLLMEGIYEQGCLKASELDGACYLYSAYIVNVGLLGKTSGIVSVTGVSPGGPWLVASLSPPGLPTWGLGLSVQVTPLDYTDSFGNNFYNAGVDFYVVYNTIANSVDIYCTQATADPAATVTFSYSLSVIQN
jgi:hypothetical protein